MQGFVLIPRGILFGLSILIALTLARVLGGLQLKLWQKQELRALS